MSSSYNFVNLTNGLEWCETLSNYSFIRIQSTTVERKDYIKLLMDLDHNFLMHMALGHICNVYDCGTNKPYSKAIYNGLEIIKYCLNREWFNLNPIIVNRRIRSGHYNHDNILNQLDNIYCNMFVYDNNKEKEKLKRKIRYYKRFIKGNEINLTGFSKSTKNDGNYKYYAELTNNL